MGRPLQFAFTNAFPALRQPQDCFLVFERQKAKKALLWNKFCLYISLKKFSF